VEHLGQWALAGRRLNLSRTSSPEEVLALVARAGQDGPVIGMGHRAGTWNRQVTVAELDAVRAGVPVVLINSDCHHGWLNTAALDALGLARRDTVVAEAEWFAAYPLVASVLEDPPAPADYQNVLRKAAAQGIVGLVDFEFGAPWSDWAQRWHEGCDLLRIRWSPYRDQLDSVRAAGLRSRAALPGADDRLRKAADLLRSWDGRLSTDSAAASLVTQARAALRKLILEPKLGELASEYRWSESNFALEEIIMHGNSDWLPPGYKDWDALLTEAVRRGMQKTREHPAAPHDVSQWAYGNWHVLDIEHPLAPFLPVVSRIAGTGPQPLSGDTTTVKQVGRAFGPSQRFTMDWSNIDDSTENIVLGESSNPYSPYFRDQWNDYYNGTTFALPFSPAGVAAQTRHTLRLMP